MSNNNAFKGSLATPSISDSPIVADSQATNEKWLAQQLSESGITNPVLVKQFKPHKAGFTVTGVDIAGKPNGNSWQLRLREVGKDGAKYKTRRRKEGETGCIYDALLLRGKLTDFPKVAERAKEHVSLDTNKGDLWQWIYCFPHLPIAITEGAKKAACGIENGYITLSIPGCTMGHKPGSNELVDTLGAVCEEGRPVTLLPDYDFRSNPAVYRAWLKLAKTIEATGCKVTIGCWELTDVPNHERLTTENIKGMDDFIARGGNFDEVIRLALTIAEWEKQFPEPEKKKGEFIGQGDGAAVPTKKMSPVEYAEFLANSRRYLWRFHNEQKTWREWNGQYWEAVPEEKIGDFIHHEAKPIIKNDSWVVSCMSSLARELRQFKWMPPSQIITPFRNGVVNLREMTIKPHNPENYNTNMIDRDWWQPEGEAIADSIKALQTYCPNIYEAWHYAMGGNKRKIIRLLSVCNAVMLWRMSYMNVFVHLIGKPGSGKGTFIRLLELLVGDGNYYGGKLRSLSNENKVAMCIDKQLLSFPEEKEVPSVAVVDTLKSMTTLDNVDFHRKFKDWGSSRYYGSIVMASNDPIFKKDLEALYRRVRLIHFDRAIPNRSYDVEELMRSEISQLTYVALSLPKDVVESAINGTGEYKLPSSKTLSWLLECDSSSVAAFLDEELIPKPEHRLLQKDAYAEYRKYCQESGMSPVSVKEFGKRLESAAARVGLPLTKKHSNRGQQLIGVDLREEVRDMDIPTFSQKLELQESSNGGENSSLSSLSSQDKGSNRHSSVTHSSPFITSVTQPSLFTTPESLSSSNPSSPGKSDESKGESDEYLGKSDEQVTVETTIYQESDESDEFLPLKNDFESPPENPPQSRPLKVDDKVWVTTGKGKRPGIIINCQDEYDEWECQVNLGTNDAPKWKIHRFSTEELEPREEPKTEKPKLPSANGCCPSHGDRHDGQNDDNDGQTYSCSSSPKSGDYSVGDKVWAITPDGEKIEAIITHPQDEEGKWGLKVKIGAMDEDWNGTYTYFSHDLEPR